MSKSKSPTEWLEKYTGRIRILESKMRDGKIDAESFYLQLRENEQAILNHIEELVNEVIGEDTFPEEHELSRSKYFYKNELRAKQRTQAKQLIRGKD